MLIHSSSEEDTKKFAGLIARRWLAKEKPNMFIHLRGTLGAGKTAFARGFISALTQETPHVQSPTFGLVKTYGENPFIAHLDLFRLKSLEELEQLDYETIFYKTPVVLVEWLENIPEHKNLYPENHVILDFKIQSQNERVLTFTTQGSVLQDFFRAFI